jgi:hypothetical protein
VPGVRTLPHLRDILAKRNAKARANASSDFVHLVREQSIRLVDLVLRAEARRFGRKRVANLAVRRRSPRARSRFFRRHEQVADGDA